MTSSNVSNLLKQNQDMATSLSQKDSLLSSSDVKFSAIFEKSISQGSFVSKNSINIDANITVTKEESVSRETNVDIRKSIENDKKVVDQSELKESVAEKVDSFTSEIKKVIADEMDVTEEDIEKAMEILGLTALDLMNPNDLVALISELADENNPVMLILSDEVKDILDSVAKLLGQLTEDVGLTDYQIKDLLSDFELNTNVDIEITDEIPKEDLQVITNATSEQTTDEQPEFETAIKAESNLGMTDVKPQNAEVTEESSSEADGESSFTNPTVANEIHTEDLSKKNDEANDFNKKQDKPIEFVGESHISHDQMIFADVKAEVTFNPVEETVVLPTGETVSTEEIINQLVEQARLTADTESTTMELTLNPEGLGKIFMEVVQKGDEVSARIFTQNEAVKEALVDQMATLKTDLNQAGNKITSIEVSVGTHEFERNLEENPNQEQKRDEHQSNTKQSKRTRINLDDLDGLMGLMSEEERLVTSIMQDNGGTLNYQV